MKYLFIRPAVSGADKVIVDLATVLSKDPNNRVTIAANNCDLKYCFDECRDLDFILTGQTNSPILGKLGYLFNQFMDTLLLCSYLVCFHYSLVRRADLIILDVDNLPAILLRIFLSIMWFVELLCSFSTKKLPVFFFYCHFPNIKISQSRSILHDIWRMPFLYLLRVGYRWCDIVAFNSKFTESVFHQTYPHLRVKRTLVIYPPVSNPAVSPSNILSASIKKNFILSLNRFDEYKNLERAIYLFQFLKNEKISPGIKLCIAGGLEKSASQAVYDRLVKLCQTMGLKCTTYNGGDAHNDICPGDVDIVFLTGISSSLKMELISSTRLLFYTPSFEHFGLVPIEVMAIGKAVVFAMNSGGPTEYISHGRTGFLLPDRTEFSSMPCFEERSFIDGYTRQELEELRYNLKLAFQTENTHEDVTLQEIKQNGITLAADKRYTVSAFLEQIHAVLPR